MAREWDDWGQWGISCETLVGKTGRLGWFFFVVVVDTLLQKVRWLMSYDTGLIGSRGCLFGPKLRLAPFVSALCYICLMVYIFTVCMSNSTATGLNVTSLLSCDFDESTPVLLLMFYISRW